MNWREGSDGRVELVSSEGAVVAEVLGMGDGRFRPRAVLDGRGAMQALPDWSTREAAQHAAEIALHMVS